MKLNPELQQRMREAFVIECQDHLDRLQGLLAELHAGPVAESSFSEAMRSLHSLKGSSRLLSLSEIEQLAHHGETLLLEMQRQPGQDLDQGIEAFQQLVHALEDATHLDLARESSLESERPHSEERPALRSAARIGVGELERVIRASDHLAQQVHLMQNLEESFKSFQAELPLAAGLRLDHLRRQLQKLGKAVHQSAFELRTSCRELISIPARDLLGALPSVARDLAQRKEKRVEFSASGLETRVELPLLQALQEMLPHLVSNAIVHGIERLQEREQSGKPPMGRIALHLESVGEHLKVFIEDDGAGLRADQLAQRAAQLGVAEELASEELLFVEGLTTRSEADQLSGRGYGMAAVRERVQEFGGSVSVVSPLGPQGGTRVELLIPHGSWGIHILKVRCADQLVAFPSRIVSGLRRVPHRELRRHGTGWAVLRGEQFLPVVSLARRLGLGDSASLQDPLRLVEVTLEGESRLWAVDEWSAHRPAQLQALACPPGAWPEGMWEGAFLSRSGRACLVLNPAFLSGPADQDSWAPVALAGQKLVLVVDDSPVTRILTATALEQSGYRVIQAGNGQEALQVLEREAVALVLTDVQMPVLDGFELLREIRLRPQWEDLPVILLTSLSKPEEQRRGLDGGADAYILKQNFDQKLLLETVERLL